MRAFSVVTEHGRGNHSLNATTLCTLLSLLVLGACATDAPEPVGVIPIPRLQLGALRSGWSEPVNLGPVVNSPASDLMAKLSPDELSLYFVSNRPGGVGTGNDIWVSHRASRESPWETPANLVPINSGADDAAPSLSADGHLLFFNSARSGGEGAADIYVSRRMNVEDDFGWERPVNLGPLVNTAGGERGPQFILHGENGEPTLYFNRGVLGANGADIFAVPMTKDGEPIGPAVPVPNVNVPDANDAGQYVRHNGKEMWFFSGRSGGSGGADLWVSARKSIYDTWSPPVNLGSPPNTEFAEERPFVTRNSRTLLFDSLRPDGISGSQDIWMSTRGDGDDDDEDSDEGLVRAMVALEDLAHGERSSRRTRGRHGHLRRGTA